MTITMASLRLWWILAFLYPIEASLWSFRSTSSEESNKNDLVSPIINREIQVSVKAPWPSSPSNMYCEAWAFLKDFDFLDALVANSFSPATDYQQTTEHVMEIAKQLSHYDDHLLRLLQFSLAMRAKSPTCELYRKLGEQYKVNTLGEPFAVIHGTHVTQDLNGLELANSRTMSQTELDALLLPGEVPYRHNLVEKADPIVLYANLASPSFRMWYHKLLSLDIPFVVRHYGGKGESEESTTVLQGYGVRLDVRNVEYKVFDDRQDQEYQEQAMLNVSNVNSTVPQFLAGVNLSAALLLEDFADADDNEMDHQELQSKLWKIHEEQLKHTQMIPPTWQRRQLSLQAATAIAQSNGNELFTLEQVSQDLPSLASTLVHVQVPEEISQVAGVLEDSLQQLIRESGGGFWINGKPFHLQGSSFNVFEMIETLQNEKELLDDLQTIFSPYFDGEALQHIQTAWLQGEGFFKTNDSEGQEMEERDNKHFRINVASDDKNAVMYLNDIEKDSQYNHWPTSMQQMIMGMQYGMPPTVRRNLATILSVTNPLDGGQMPFGKSLFNQIAQANYPVRLGLLIVDDKDVAECAKWVQRTKSEAPPN